MWVLDPEKVDRAIEIIRRYEAHHPTTEGGAHVAWTCPGCSEEVDEGFEICWNCHTPHAHETTP
ncbi:MAG: hypothetical protein H6832_10350 [Planctomycetes bacterium]|nr:hypothetical protein [Planctomycetota bacterium]MCB9918790.1 hypothetical protein [Planctomycetota bacterium]